MSDLIAFRDHARRQAHRPRIVNRDRAGHVTSTSGPTDAERDLWLQLANEIDTYLASKAGPVEDLFGGASTEPKPMPGGYLVSTPRDMPRGIFTEPLPEEPEVPC